MSRLAFAITPIALLLTCAAAQATPADPHVIFDTAVAGLPVTPVHDFPVQTNPNGGGVFNFRNETGNDWVGVDLIVTLATGEKISCTAGPFFSTCEFTSTPINANMAVYDIGFDEPRSKGITPGTIFSLNFNNVPNAGPNGAGGWGEHTPFEAKTTLATPEPASLLLLGSGVALLGILRRSRKQRER